MLNRREFSATLTLAAASGLLRPRAAFGNGQRATVFDWRPIKDNMQAAFGAGGNALAIGGGGHTLLIDTKNAGYGAVLRAEAESFGGPLERVINTHHHGDHTGGNPFFTTADIPVIGQTRGVDRARAGGSPTLAGILRDPAGRLERLNQQVANMDISEDAKRAGSESVAAFVALGETMTAMDFSATETFDEELEVRIGDTRVELRYIDRGHTDNDVFVFIPAANVLHGGDLFFNGIHPRIDTSADATTVGWQKCLKAMIDACNRDTVCIPGHGEISDVAGLRSFSNYFDILRDFVGKQIEAGRSRDQISEMQPPQFVDWPPARLSDNLGIVYDELKAGG